MLNHFKSVKFLDDIFMILLVGASLSSCANYDYQYYSIDGKQWTTKCTYMDSTYFMNGRQTELKKELGYVAIQNRDIRGGWQCLLTWSKDTTYIIEPYNDFYIKNHPNKIKLLKMRTQDYNKILNDMDKHYIKLEYK